jgi:superfamily II DNA or RNA helicase
MTQVHLKFLTHTHCQVVTDRGTLMELADEMTWKAENYRFHPKYKARIWDGNISLLNRVTGVCYMGLAQRIKKFCDQRNYNFTFDEELLHDNISVKEVEDMIASLNLPEWVEIRDYQVDATVKCLRSRRRTLVSPTGSGKSLMIYFISQWYKEKALIIVPTIGLVAQMKNDFESYVYKGRIHVSTDGLSKDFDIPADIVITTWQSLDNGKNKVNKKWYDQFKVVIGDECHGAKATTLIKILSAMENTPYRFGTTGTLDNIELNKATIEGLFGAQYKTTTTRALIDQGHVADIKIKCIKLKYSEAIAQSMRGKTYQEEIDFLTTYAPRNEFIKNLALSLKGNKLVFFRLIDHGQELYAMFGGKDDVFYIAGDVGVTEREEIRKAMEIKQDAILVASLGTTSTGVSIKKLHHMIAASPSKSKIKVLQSIGRMLRQHESKEHAVLYDIVDDLSFKSHKNYTLKHFDERMKIYENEKFSHKIYNVRI